MTIAKAIEALERLKKLYLDAMTGHGIPIEASKKALDDAEDALAALRLLRPATEEVASFVNGTDTPGEKGITPASAAGPESATQEKHEDRRQPCPACPDGNEWDSNGPTGRACRVCQGRAYLGPLMERDK